MHVPRSDYELVLGSLSSFITVPAGLRPGDVADLVAKVNPPARWYERLLNLLELDEHATFAGVLMRVVGLQEDNKRFRSERDALSDALGLWRSWASQHLISPCKGTGNDDLVNRQLLSNVTNSVHKENVNLQETVTKLQDTIALWRSWAAQHLHARPLFDNDYRQGLDNMLTRPTFSEESARLQRIITRLEYALRSESTALLYEKGRNTGLEARLQALKANPPSADDALRRQMEVLKYKEINEVTRAQKWVTWAQGVYQALELPVSANISDHEMRTLIADRAICPRCTERETNLRGTLHAQNLELQSVRKDNVEQNFAFTQLQKEMHAKQIDLAQWETWAKDLFQRLALLPTVLLPGRTWQTAMRERITNVITGKMLNDRSPYLEVGDWRNWALALCGETIEKVSLLTNAELRERAQAATVERTATAYSRGAEDVKDRIVRDVLGQ